MFPVPVEDSNAITRNTNVSATYAHHSVDRISFDIFQDCAMADGLKDLRLLLLGEVDALGIAASLNVENTSSCPAMLVITDQLPAATRIR